MHSLKLYSTIITKNSKQTNSEINIIEYVGARAVSVMKVNETKNALEKRLAAVIVCSELHGVAKNKRES